MAVLQVTMVAGETGDSGSAGFLIDARAVAKVELASDTPDWAKHVREYLLERGIKQVGVEPFRRGGSKPGGGEILVFSKTSGALFRMTNAKAENITVSVK